VTYQQADSYHFVIPLYLGPHVPNIKGSYQIIEKDIQQSAWLD